jgi:phage N-6-adenine-methyltransferase
MESSLLSRATINSPTASSVHFSSRTDLWPTPQGLFNELKAEFAFTLDVCATSDNTKCQRFFSPIDDGLKQTWTGTCWMNPPYRRANGRWMRKAYESAQAGALVVTVVPARTDTEWWHEWASKGEARFIRGRVRFGSAKASAPFPSAIVISRPPPKGQTKLQRAFFRHAQTRSANDE